MKILAVATNTFSECVRNKIVYSVFLFAALLVAVSAAFGSVTIGDRNKVIKDFGLFALSFGGVLITIISGVGLLQKELRRKTIYNILSKPITRLEFLLGKFAGLVLTAWAMTALMTLALVSLMFVLEGRPDRLLFQAFALSALEISIVAAIVIFFSSMVVTTTLTGIFTFGVYLGGRSINYLNYFLTNEKDSRPLIRFFVTGFDRILPDLSLFNFNDAIVYGIPVPASHIGLAILYALFYSMTALSFAALIFHTRELT